MPLYPNVAFVCLPRSLTAASPCSYHRTVISRSDGYSVVKDHRRVNTLHLLWTTGVKKTTFSTELFLRFSNCLQTPLIFLGQRGGKIHPCCRKKYSVFSAGSDILHHIQTPPSFLNPLNEKTLIFLSRHIKNKARKRNCSNVPKNNRTKEEVFSRSRGKDFLRRASYPSIKKTPWIQNDTVIPYHSDSHGAL